MDFLRGFGLTDGIEKLEKSRSGVLIVVHFFFGSLTGSAVKNAHFVFVRESLFVQSSQSFVGGGSS